MAALTTSGVTENDYWPEGRFRVKDVTLALVAQGGTSNTIPASIFGFSYIRDVRGAVDSNGNAVAAKPSYNRSGIVISKPVQTNYVATGTNGAGNITLTGLATTDEILSVTDITTPAQKTLTDYSIGSANTMAQASGAGNTSAKSLLVITNKPAAGAPTDITATVRMLVVGI